VDAHFQNRYTPFVGLDNQRCFPVVELALLNRILFRMTELAETMVGAGPKPQVSYDLEHIQVASYADFADDEQQKALIHNLQTTNPIRTDDMAYLALRSMIGLSWKGVTCEEDVRRAAAYEKALELTLVEASQVLGQKLSNPDALLPYWGRLAFLRVMTAIPEEQIESHRLDRVACVLLKDPAFNARSYQYEEHGLIGLNFALEPILKGLNRMLLHFFHTKEMAGPMRLPRAWSSLAPVVAYFWVRTPVAVNRLTPYHAMFDSSMLMLAQLLTASQIDCIVRHELGHLALNHGRRLSAVPKGFDTKALRDEFEHSADAFAQAALRCGLYNRLRSSLQWARSQTGEYTGGAHEGGLNALHDHQQEASGMRLLFYYMEAIDRLGRLLLARFGDRFPIRTMADSHPSPKERLARLDAFALSECPPTSPLLRYAEEFLEEIVTYAGALDDDQLWSPLADAF